VCKIYIKYGRRSLGGSEVRSLNAYKITKYVEPKLNDQTEGKELTWNRWDQIVEKDAPSVYHPLTITINRSPQRTPDEFSL